MKLPSLAVCAVMVLSFGCTKTPTDEATRTNREAPVTLRDPNAGGYGGGPRSDMSRRDGGSLEPGARSDLTPMDQGNSDADRATTQQIRQALVADKSLSFDAKNVKIITKNGAVTLRGAVENQDERASVEAVASRIAGPTRVDNELEIKGK